MNRRKFLGTLVGLLAAPAIIQALGNNHPETVVMHVTQKPMRLKSTDWTMEMEQDLESYHDISVDEDVVKAMSEEISRGIDKEVLEQLNRYEQT